MIPVELRLLLLDMVGDGSKDEGPGEACPKRSARRGGRYKAESPASGGKALISGASADRKRDYRMPVLVRESCRVPACANAFSAMALKILQHRSTSV